MPREIQPHLPVTLGVFGPVLAYLDVDEQMDRPFQNFRQLLASGDRDGLDGFAALAEDDLLLAVTFDENGLLDAGGAVLLVLPLVGLDGRGIGQLVVEAHEHF